MTIKEKILNHGVGCFDELVDSFSDAEIEEMCGEIIREDFQDDFSYKCCVVFSYIKEWLIEEIDSNSNSRETQKLFAIYCAA